MSIIDKIRIFLITLDLSRATSIIASLAGVAGFFLSIYVFRINRRDHRPRLSITIDREDVDFDSSNESEDIPPMDIVFIDIANPSERRIKVVSILLEWSKQKGLIRKRLQSDLYPNFQTHKKPPFFLVPGDNASYATETDDLIYWLANSKHVSGKVNIRAKVRDGTKNLYISKWFILNVMK